MAEPNVSLNAGIIPGAGLPPDLATQQLQLQVQQQLAEALLAKSLQDVPSTVSGPSGNPYARDTVNIGGMLNKLINARAGQSRLDQILPQQAAISQRGEEIRQQDMRAMLQDVMGGPTPGPYVGGSIDKKPDLAAGIARGLLSAHPAVQAHASALEKVLTEAKIKSMATPESAAAATRNITPESLAASLFPDQTPYGLGSQFNIGKWQMKAVPREGPGGAQGTLYPKVGAQVEKAGDLQAEPKPIIPADSPDNPTGADLQLTPEGTYKPLETPVTKIAEGVGKEHIKTLEEGRTQGQAYVEQVPKLTTMLGLINNADLRWGGEQITKARQIATSLGLSQDVTNKIVDTQTFLKYALPQAAENARAFNSRATQLEFQKFSDAAAANQNIDPRAAKNILMQSVLDGINANMMHEKNIGTFSGVPAVGKKNAESYRVKNFPTVEQILEPIHKVTGGEKIDVGADYEGGPLRNRMVGQSGPLPGGKGPKQWQVEKLKADPSLKADFDKMFGVGAADKILSGK